MVTGSPPRLSQTRVCPLFCWDVLRRSQRNITRVSGSFKRDKPALSHYPSHFEHLNHLWNWCNCSANLEISIEGIAYDAMRASHGPCIPFQQNGTRQTPGECSKPASLRQFLGEEAPLRSLESQKVHLQLLRYVSHCISSDTMVT